MFQTSVVQEIKTHVLWSITFFFYENRVVYVLIWKKEGRARPVTDDHRGLIQRMRIACLITKALNTDSEYVIRTAFPLQQWLIERASMLRLYAHDFLVYVRYFCYIVWSLP